MTAQAPPTTTPPPAPTPSGDSRDTSRDFTRSYTQIHAELKQDSAELQRQVLLWQRWIRYAAVLVAGVGAVARYGAGDARAAWLPVAVAGGVYFVFTALMSRVLHRTPEAGLPPLIPVLTLFADLAMISVLIYFTAPPSQFHRILILGFLGLQLTVFYFGRGLGIAAALATVASYVWFSRFMPMHLPGPRPTIPVLMVNSALFLFVSGVLVMTFGSFRLRMNALRSFVKRVEMGDFSGEYDSAGDARPDDLTLLGQSYNEMRSRLIELVGTDVVTGCLNRRAFESRLLREWRQAKRRNSTLALLMIDIDHFKEINDTHGHAAGDAVLAEIGEIMRGTARDTDTVARLGGDEFVVMLPDTAWQGAMTFAERLRRNVHEHSFGESEGKPVPITVSVGVALAKGSDPVTDTDLLESADRSLYKAKSGGRNRISA